MDITIEELKISVAQLPQDQLRRFRAWYQKFDSEAWDTQIEKDIFEGKLDNLADAAIADHKSGKTKKL